MAFSSVIGASSVIKPGVVTSSTRPSSPFVGQLIFETDTNRLAVYNGSVWVAAGSGLHILKNETTFTAATQIVCDNVFSSLYVAYKIFMRLTGTTGGALGLRLRVGGVAASSNYNQQIVSVASTTFTGVRQTAQTSFPIAAGSTGTFFQSVECLLTGPALAEGTTFQSNFQISDGAYTLPFVQIIHGNHSTATAYDGFELNAASGNVTGVYSVFGIPRVGA